MAMMAKTRLSTAPLVAVVPATDLARAEKFYGETLGLELERDPNIPQFRARAGEGCWMLVYETTSTAGTATQAGFMVDDLDATVAELRDHGVKFEEYDMPGLRTVNGIASVGDMRSSWFKDSEGNTIAVTQTQR